MRRVAFVGAGFIADTHARALAYIDGAELAALVEPDEFKRNAFAQRWSVPQKLENLDQLLASGACDVAHVLVPPPRHFAVAEALLRNRVSVFLEKPMAVSKAECAALSAVAAAHRSHLQVNHNYLHHPIQQRFKMLLRQNRIGPVRHFSCKYNMPLRQLAAGQLTHWMFDSPLNLLLEQAVHPLAQVHDLFGAITATAVVHASPVHHVNGARIVQNWAISAVCAAGQIGQLQLGFGQSYPIWTIAAVGDDGAITADYFRNRIVVDRPGPYLDLVDRWRATASSTAQIVKSDANTAAGYIVAQLGDKRRGDYFLASMVESARKFYARLNEPAAAIDEIGSHVVANCEALAAAAAPGTARARRVPWRGQHEVLVTGGTGFLGRHVVRALARARMPVAVLARDGDSVGSIFRDDPVKSFSGNILAPDSLDVALQGCRTVVNLAPGGSEHPAALSMATVDGARNVAEGAAQCGVKHLVHVSSIAALYLGRAGDTIRGDSAVDPHRARRAEYARAKAEAEDVVRAVGREHGLAVTILRPGVVVGEGRTPFHSGVGEFNCETYCLGWNRGRNPLPFVLVEDVAAAIAKAVELGPAAGGSFNLVGDARLTAREYIEELGKALGRPLRYHPRPLARLYGTEWLKWLVKRGARRRDAALPSYRDLKSRGLVARFDTADVKAALSWRPEATRAGFIERALACHVR